MKNSKLLKLLALLTALGLIAAACGSDDAETDSDGSETTGSTDDTTSDGGDEDEKSDDDTDGSDLEEAAMVDLAEYCPNPLVLQTDWFPEAEHGAVYEMIGEGYTVDADNMIVRGPLVSEGVEMGIDWEVRAGGPSIGFSPVAAHVYSSDEIHLGYANTEAQALQFDDAPMISVVAPLEKNPQMIMWDPETYPEVETIADLGEENVIVKVFGGGEFAGVFTAQGIWNEDQIDPTYDGSPANFIASGGTIAQQGFASAEPYLYENEFTDWAKPVAYQLLHDAGFEVYAATIGVRGDQAEELSDCLTHLVPIIQMAVVSYDASPDRANAIIVDAVEQFDSFWQYDMDLANFSVETQRELGLIGNGDDDTVGNMDAARIQGVIDSIADAGVDLADITAEDIFTNEYIDPSIGF